MVGMEFSSVLGVKADYSRLKRGLDIRKWGTSLTYVWDKRMRGIIHTLGDMGSR